MPLKILAVGDVHLGKLPARLPPELRNRAREAGPAGTWDRMVEFALKNKVDGVVFAGDLVEGEQDYFEACRTLHRGVSRMTGEGIRVLGVAGNHDVSVLPRLARQVPGFELLGENGTWQHIALKKGSDQAHLWGWSFPERIWPHNPLRDFTFTTEGRPGPHIGILHCDRDQTDSNWAPVSREDLRLAGPEAWLLGHIHKPDNLSVQHPMGYLGSVTGTDPGEPGVHGPWLLTTGEQRILEIRQIPLATMRWEPLQVRTAADDSISDIREKISEGCLELDRTICTGEYSPLATGLRLRFHGHSPRNIDLTELLTGQEREHLFTGLNNTHYFVEKVQIETRPEVALQELATGSHPPGLLARRLLLLEEPADHPDRMKLLDEARKKFTAAKQESRWSGSGVSVPSQEDIANYLRRSGLALLERLLRQQKEQS